ncbi:MAG: type II toxin-antitoxin system VapC family toxin [Candidatus Tectomicrobia bacterium]|uniref:Type II toxin-antitoxin system VapC family toxin n=1 Tax=Tectimicrobiota bacterium TaxID=2528274 RepID=A0A932GRS6_UNCTE|nr:type II toxin-antitoxin system VapC family toxin [Candidatus Tectomicrobia bacterium]
MFLIDTNVWLELLLEQEKAAEARRFFTETEASLLSITDFALYSIGVILIRLRKDGVFRDFLTDVLEDSGVRKIHLETGDLKEVITAGRQFQLDFDDAYQLVAAEKFDLTIVSFDADFDRTRRGRKAPSEAIAGSL